MLSYFGHQLLPIWLSQWVRYWLTLLIYRKRFVVIDGQRYITKPLTMGEKSIVFAVHVVVLGVAIGGTILLFLGFVRLVYG